MKQSQTPNWAVLAFCTSLLVSPLALAQTTTAPASPAKTGGTFKKFSVVIDAGHGGHDVGDGEKEINLTMASQLRAELEKQGIQVVMTRSRDEFLPLADRVAVANAIKPDCFISIHGQKTSKRTLPFDVSYNETNSLLLAQTINRDLNNEMNFAVRGELVKARYYVVSKTVVPSVMVTGNYKTLATPEAQKKFVLALATGIEDYARLQKSLARTPILRDIPGLGQLFKGAPLMQTPPAQEKPLSPMLRKPEGNFNFLGAKIKR